MCVYRKYVYVCIQMPARGHYLHHFRYAGDKHQRLAATNLLEEETEHFATHLSTC